MLCRHHLCRPLLWLQVCLLPLAAGADAPLPPILQGEIDHARFTIARPAVPWNGRLLLHAHGYRSPEAPRVADLSVEHAAYATLLDEGWVVATTSYRRNGMILGDAMRDLDALREHIVKTLGEPSLVILEGESMGGAIVTLLAERGTGSYQGAVAIGAALQAREDNGVGGVALQPKVPIVFLTNQSEMEGPKHYVNQASTEARLNPSLVAPVLFKVSHNGHVNVNQAERLVALRALVSWIEHGRDTLPKPNSLSVDGSTVYGSDQVFDATVTPPPQPTRVTFDADGRGFTATVTEISAIYGNAFVDAQTADFEKAGISPGSYFKLTVGDQTFRVRYGRGFDSVPRGQWVMFPNADGFFWLARNYQNAAETAGLTTGGKVHLSRYTQP